MGDEIEKQWHVTTWNDTELAIAKTVKTSKTAKYIWTWIRSANSFTAINIIIGLYVIRESN